MDIASAVPSGQSKGFRPLVGAAVKTIAVGRWQYPLVSRAPVVLLYHGVSALDSVMDMDVASFRSQMLFLGRHYRVVDWREEVSRTGFDRPTVILTFDDGFRNNIDVAAPILQSLGLPAIFFVSTRHADPGKPLWARHLRLIRRLFPGKSLHFDERRLDLSRDARERSMDDLERELRAMRPHPQAIYEALEQLPAPGSFIKPSEQADRYEGLTKTDIAHLAADGLFTIGLHSQDHPLMTLCDRDEQKRQLVANQRVLQAASGQPCDIFAYPNNDYDAQVLKVVKEVGLQKTFAVRVRLGADARHEVPRFGIYLTRTADLATKVQWGPMLRRYGKL